MQSSNFKREFSAGCVVFKKFKVQNSKFKIQFLLGKHSGYHKWVLPKGLIEEDEKGWQTAVRETEEEMGVKAKLISDKPIHVEKYVYHADLKNQQENSKSQASNNKQTSNSNVQNSKQDRNTRRVEKYKEEGGKKTKVFKTVSFYLAEYVSGDPKDHGWEMEDGGWFAYDKALKLLAFKGEKEALEKAKKRLQEIKKQPSLFS